MESSTVQNLADSFGGEYHPLLIKPLISHLIATGILQTDVNEIIGLMEAYNNLPPFNDSAFLLGEIKKKGRQTIALSNGSVNMLAPLLHNSGLDRYFDLMISVDEIKQYKPSPAAYSLVLDHTVLNRDDILFTAAHGWDISGAESFGFHTAWINRKQQRQEELQLPPDYEFQNLTSVLRTLE